MVKALAITVRFHDGRYHGTVDWPPAPARLFQALIAGATRGETLTEDTSVALGWLEKLPASEIAAPRARRAKGFDNFVPNNALDAVDADVRRIGEIRTRKLIRPHLFEGEVPFLYVWRFDARDEDIRLAKVVCAMAEGLYQFGRGVDMAWAWGEVLEESEVEARLASHGGTRYRPTERGTGISLDCPMPGSRESLEKRFRAQGRRFEVRVQGKKVLVTFTQAPKPRFKPIAYNSLPVRALFDLRTTLENSRFVPWPLAHSSALVQCVRDKAAERLTKSLPKRAAEIERILIGRNATEADKVARVRIIPLPSIGHQHVDCAIRRVLLEISPGCSIRAGDLVWAFSGLVVRQEVDGATGEILEDTRLVAADEPDMLRHYGVGTERPVRIWRTVTAAALPERTARRRIDPRRLSAVKGGPECAQEHHVAATAVIQALRHARIDAKVSSIRVQREPFEAKGARAEVFAAGTRFAKERLWHVEITLAEPVAGPLILGDGRYLGLGLMAPLHRPEGVHCFSILAGLNDRADAMVLARALRRAVMARVQERLGRRAKLPVFFSGHEPDGGPSRNGRHAHLALAIDLKRSRMLVVAPHVLEGCGPTRDEEKHLELLDESLADLSELRAGTAGRLGLARVSIDLNDDPLFAPAQCWESVTEYQLTRHVKRVSPEEALLSDVRAELIMRSLPAPTHIEVIDMREGPRGGLTGRLRLQFATAVSGLIMIGRSRHVGGGLFSAAAGGSEA
ncbi:MAG: type I-G CRISPR-associated protein Csb2 [Opitutaceae bacterium]